jgi:hypothetical protein
VPAGLTGRWRSQSAKLPAATVTRLYPEGGTNRVAIVSAPGA